MAARTGRHVLLIGLPGSGKSTVAPELAGMLGVEWTDLDEAVVARAGLSVPELFEQFGEQHFRDLELAEFRNALDGPPRVLAAGGGLLGSERARSLAADCEVVWLRARLDTLLARLGPDERDARPLLGARGAGPGEQSLRAGLARLDERRAHTYSETADVVVEVDGRSPREVADIVLDGLTGAEGAH